MSISRRKFFNSAAALFLKPGSFAMAQESACSNHAKTSSHLYSRATFEPLVGDTFRVRVGEQTVDLKLVAIADLKSNAAGVTTGRTSNTDCFSLRFHTPAQVPTPATLHNLEHKALGSFGLFMTQSDAGSIPAHGDRE